VIFEPWKPWNNLELKISFWLDILKGSVRRMMNTYAWHFISFLFFCVCNLVFTRDAGTARTPKFYGKVLSSFIQSHPTWHSLSDQTYAQSFHLRTLLLLTLTLTTYAHSSYIRSLPTYAHSSYHRSLIRPSLTHPTYAQSSYLRSLFLHTLTLPIYAHSSY